MDVKGPKPKKSKKTKKSQKKRSPLKKTTRSKAVKPKPTKKNTPAADDTPSGEANTDVPTELPVRQSGPAPKTLLAKQAKKKGVHDGDLYEDQIANALKIGNTDSLDLEGKIKFLEEVFNQCQLQKIPEHQVQRFIARIFSACKSCGFLVGMSHSIFKKEPTHIRVLEADLNETHLSWSQKKELLDKLLCVALPRGLDTEVLNQSKHGQSWTPVYESLSEEEVELMDKSVMTEKTLVQDNESQTTPPIDADDAELLQSGTVWDY